MKLLNSIMVAASLFCATGAMAFEVQKVRVAPHQTQKAADETAHLTRKGVYPVVAMPSKTKLEFNERLSVAQVVLSTEKGGAYDGWTLLRITLGAPADIAGEVLLDITYDDRMIEDTPATSKTINLDVMGNTRLEAAAHNYYFSVYPAAVSKGLLTLDYFLRSPDGARTEIVGHSIPVKGTVFVPGKAEIIADCIPAKPGNEWNVREYKTDAEAKKKQVLDIVKRCKIASCQLTYVDHLDSIGFVVVNSEVYKAAREKSPEKRPIDMQSIYQAASMSKVPCSYIFTKLVNDGELDLDTPLYKYYPGFINRFRPAYREQAKLITGRMALTHTSGGGGGYGNIPLDLYPGYHLNYRNVNTVMAQYVIEYIKGKRLDEVAEDYVYSKRNMPNSRYTWQPQYDSLAVWSLSSGKYGTNHNRDWEKNDYIKSSDFPWDKGRAGMDNNSSFHWRTNSTECQRFWGWLLEGADLNEEMFNQFICQGIHKPADDISLERGKMFYGLGTRSEFNDELGAVTWHTGRNGPYRSLGIAFLERNASMAIFTNTRHQYDFLYPVIDVFLPHAQRMEWTLWVAGAGTPVPGWVTTEMKKNGRK